MNLMRNASAAQTKGLSLKQQIRVVEQRLIGRRLLLRNQWLAVQQALHQTLTTSVNVLLMSGVVFVLGYVASRTASTNSTAQSPSLSSATSKPTGVLNRVLTFITNTLKCFAAFLAFAARILDAVSMVRYIQHFFAPPSIQHAPHRTALVHPAQSAPIIVARVRTIKTIPWWWLALMCAISVVALLMIIVGLGLSVQ